MYWLITNLGNRDESFFPRCALINLHSFVFNGKSLPEIVNKLLIQNTQNVTFSEHEFGDENSMYTVDTWI